MTNSFYPVVMSNDVLTSTNFFKDNFGFEETFSSDWYVSLKKDEKFELAIINSNHDTIPSNYKANCKGLILNFELDNVDEIYSKMVSNKSIKVIMNIKNEDFGQRHFIIESPDNILIDIIQIIPPTEEFLAQYKDFDRDSK